jgi:aspartate/methionine/tyrosine aminotransferase
MQQVIKQCDPPPVSLAQGIVHWNPPTAAIERLRESIESSASELNAYQHSQGWPPLVAALEEKLSCENALRQQPGASEVTVTAGANQAYVNVLLATVDAEDTAVFFAPYYFNHVMAAQMAGGGRTVEIGPCDERYGARFRQRFTLEDAIGSHACSIQASRRVTNAIPLGCPLSYQFTL